MPKDTFLNLPSEKQDKVMRSAINEFSKHGFEKGNVGDIAKKAEVAKGSMYQYFQNKKELFLYSIHWSIDLLTKKYDKYVSDNSTKNENIDIFDFFYHNSKNIWMQLTDEKEIVIFIQDVFLGKYNSLTDESMTYLMRISDELVLKQIQDGKKNGYIRKDIDDNILSLFMTGVSLKIKDHMMSKARLAGTDIVNEDFEVIEGEIKAMIELLKNGMGAK
ncbi:MAG: TetR/AcrR family transcriptional regulator [Clostridium lundense]|nr:TetR/AcrR family transcriptional regulator [Clostridium lundense]